jgi:MYXO-CTERM domain-containing protein
VNGGGSTRLNPAGDIVAAYWMGRLLSRAGADANVSPHAREPLPWTPRARTDAGTVALDAGTPSGPVPTAGCGCRAGGGGGSAWLALASLALLARPRRRTT